jgi:reverse gyrase
MGRIKMVQEIYEQLSYLEDAREVARLESQDIGEISLKIDELRSKLQDIMNSKCPIIEDSQLE